MGYPTRGLGEMPDTSTPLETPRRYAGYGCYGPAGIRTRVWGSGGLRESKLYYGPMVGARRERRGVRTFRRSPAARPTPKSGLIDNFARVILRNFLPGKPRPAP